VTEDPKSVGNVLTASLPAALASGMIAIGALLISLQVQSARIEATVQQMVRALEELKIDSKAQWNELDQRVRALEIRK
jgi:hypothetical protein